MYDVIIIGAGISGLTTAYKILQKEPSLKVVILEEKNTIGGQISGTSEDELWGRLFVADQYHIYNLLTDLKVPIRRLTPVSRNLKRSWDIDSGTFAGISKFELQRYINELNLKSLLFRPGTYELSADDREYSMYRHIHSKLFFDSSRLFMTNFVRLVTGTDSKDISYVEFMNVVHSCGGLRPLMNLYVESSPILLEFSADHLLGALETRLDTVVLLKMTKAVEIQHHQDFVRVREDGGTIHTARIAVLAIPWNKIIDIFITPPIPMEFETPIQAIKCYITSFIIQYDEAYWRRRGFSGDFYISDPPIYARQYQPTSLGGYMLHEEGTESLTKYTVLKELSKAFGVEMQHPVNYSQQTFEQSTLLNLPQTVPWNRIIWASTSAATLYRGCLSGAVQSGLRAAVHALLVLRPQNVTWQDVSDIQKANVCHTNPAIWDLVKSSLNVYNTTFYATIGLMVYCVIKNKNKFF